MPEQTLAAVQGIRVANMKSDTGLAMSPRKAHGAASPQISAHGRGFTFEFTPSPTVHANDRHEKVESAKGSCAHAAKCCRELLQNVLAEASSPVARLALESAYSSLVTSATAFFGTLDLVADALESEESAQEVWHTPHPVVLQLTKHAVLGSLLCRLMCASTPSGTTRVSSASDGRAGAGPGGSARFR